MQLIFSRNLILIVNEPSLYHLVIGGSWRLLVLSAHSDWNKTKPVTVLTKFDLIGRLKNILRSCMQEHSHSFACMDTFTVAPDGSGD